jgi:tRNA pseudouridine38-40 synthase
MSDERRPDPTPEPARPVRCFALTVCYDGTDFHGWQRQVGMRTVQGTIEEILARITNEAVVTEASGRTDAGVHALGQVVGFRSATRIEPHDLRRALNALLPDDVRVLEARIAPDDFHPTLDSLGKRYRYVIDNGPIGDPFRRRTCWHIRGGLDIGAMARAGRALVGTHDFRSFETDWPNRKTSVRTIQDLTVERSGSLVMIEVEADGFLYNMVRCIAGTLAQVGLGRRLEGWVGNVLRAQARVEAGPTAPARGLVLLRVRYPWSDS